MAEIVLVAVITSIGPTLLGLAALVKVLKVDKTVKEVKTVVEEVHTVIVKGHQKP